MQLEAEALGFQRAFPEVGPANVKGIETQPLRGGGWRACGFRPKSDGLTAGTTRDQRAER